MDHDRGRAGRRAGTRGRRRDRGGSASGRGVRHGRRRAGRACSGSRRRRRPVPASKMKRLSPARQAKQVVSRAIARHPAARPQERHAHCRSTFRSRHRHNVCVVCSITVESHRRHPLSGIPSPGELVVDELIFAVYGDLELGEASRSLGSPPYRIWPRFADSGGEGPVLAPSRTWPAAPASVRSVPVAVLLDEFAAGAQRSCATGTARGTARSRSPPAPSPRPRQRGPHAHRRRATPRGLERDHRPPAARRRRIVAARLSTGAMKPDEIVGQSVAGGRTAASAWSFRSGCSSSRSRWRRTTRQRRALAKALRSRPARRRRVPAREPARYDSIGLTDRRRLSARAARISAGADLPAPPSACGASWRRPAGGPAAAALPVRACALRLCGRERSKRCSTRSTTACTGRAWYTSPHLVLSVQRSSASPSASAARRTISRSLG